MRLDCVCVCVCESCVYVFAIMLHQLEQLRARAHVIKQRAKIDCFSIIFARANFVTL